MTGPHGGHYYVSTSGKKIYGKEGEEPSTATATATPPPPPTKDPLAQLAEAKGKASAAPPGTPSKDIPIVLVFGGSFNPPHLGHVKALQAAIRHAEEQGYKVGRVVVAPTADKLLRAKLGDRMYPLAERTELARRTFQSVANVDVTSKPSEEAETFVGKLRRTQLADSTARMYPGHTVVNVTGEDAAPGEKPPKGPAIYSGDKGSSHEGYFYSVMPRPTGDADISSTKIRKDIAEGKTDIPHMTPEAVKYLHEMLRAHPEIAR